MHKGKIHDWFRLIGVNGGLGYAIYGLSEGDPDFDGKSVRTAVVTVHNSVNGEIETNDGSAYTLVGPEWLPRPAAPRFVSGDPILPLDGNPDRVKGTITGYIRVGLAKEVDGSNGTLMQRATDKRQTVTIAPQALAQLANLLEAQGVGAKLVAAIREILS